jgi:hypothetical protein
MEEDNLAALAAAYVRSLLDYNPETGELRWKVDKGSMARKGTVAGHTRKTDGARLIGIDHKLYFGSHLAWLIMKGRFPDIGMEIDHRDGNAGNDRWYNLREATSQQQKWNRGPNTNNASGHKGVYFDRSRNRWAAGIMVDRHCIFLGRFDTAELASAAYETAARELFGEFYRAPN